MSKGRPGIGGSWVSFLSRPTQEKKGVSRLVINAWVDWFVDIAKEENKRQLKKTINGLGTETLSQWAGVAETLIDEAKSHSMPDLAHIKATLSAFETSVRLRSGRESKNTDTE